MNEFFNENDAKQAVQICLALAEIPPDRFGHAPDTDDVECVGCGALAYMLAYDARMEAVKRLRPGAVSIYSRSQKTDMLAAKLLEEGWLPGWYVRQSVDEMLCR